MIQYIHLDMLISYRVEIYDGTDKMSINYLTRFKHAPLVYYSTKHIKYIDLNQHTPGFSVYGDESNLTIWCGNNSPIIEKEEPFNILLIGYIP